MKKILIFLNLIILSGQTNASINSATIIANTVTALPNCLHYQISMHFCLWLGSWGRINTTPIVSHYLPDLVVTVYNKPGGNPWFEVNKILDGIGEPVQKSIVRGLTGMQVGYGNHSFQDQHEQGVIFKEVDVIGNPALVVIPHHGLLSSTATPWWPYYQSLLDSMLWRGIPPLALPEEGAALGLNVAHHVGTGLTNWGGLYPHEGKVISDNDMKAAAVVAQRAADLVTQRFGYGHIYKNLSGACGKHCTASPVVENSKETYFQMIYPISQNTCHILGSDQSWSPKMFNREGAYVWIVWRHYHGCANGHGKYIGRT